MKKTFISLACALTLAAPAGAASYFLVTPLPSTVSHKSDISITLANATLPLAFVNKSYTASLRPFLTITGDETVAAKDVRWELADGSALPAGLSLDNSIGALVGSPVEASTESVNFRVIATYKDSVGQAVYTLDVSGITLDVREIVTGGSHSCAITTAGAVKCWGNNTSGQLGNNSNTSSLVPVDVIGLDPGVLSISAGTIHTCVVTAAGAAKCWGNNGSAQLGNGSKTHSAIPVEVVGLESGVASIFASDSHSCATTTVGTVKCWGVNGNGYLGNNTTTSSAVPVDVVGLTGAVGLEGGSVHTCALTIQGGVHCWGFNGAGVLGDGTKTDRLTPVAVIGLNATVTSITAGRAQTCALTKAGGVKCWGNDAGSSVPVDIPGLSSGVTRIAEGDYHTCVVTTSGAAKCWGTNTYGQLGDGSKNNSTTPVDVVGLSSGVADLFGGASHTCAKMTSGSIKCWGRNHYGQLGNNKSTDSPSPVDVTSFN